MPTFESFDGTTLFFDDQGRGPDVVLLHGFAADSNINWVRPGITDLLLDRGFSVISLDARGHGLSGKPHETAAYEKGAMVKDVQALFDLLNLNGATVIGFSMGAHTALRLTAVEPRVGRAVLLGVGGTTMLRRSGERDPLVLAEAMEAPSAEAISNPVARQFRVMADSVGADLRALAAYSRATPFNSMDDVEAIRTPVLVVAGEDDVLAGSPGDLAARIPGARAVTVPGDHFTATGHPRLHQALVAFLDG